MRCMRCGKELQKNQCAGCGFDQAAGEYMTVFPLNAAERNPVTEIKPCHYFLNNELRCANIPRGATKIGESAYAWCKELREVKIPFGVTEIEEDAFVFCENLQEITIPGSVTKIGTNAFRSCTGLQKVVLEEGVSEIGVAAFKGCTSLQEISVPESLIHVRKDAFAECIHLKNRNEVIEKSKKNYKQRMIGEKELRFLNVQVGENLFEVLEFSDYTVLTRCLKASGKVVIPTGINRKPMVEIEEGAFFECLDIEEVIIPGGMVRIGEYAFMRCSELRKVTIPSAPCGIWA